MRDCVLGGLAVPWQLQGLWHAAPRPAEIALVQERARGLPWAWKTTSATSCSNALGMAKRLMWGPSVSAKDQGSVDLPASEGT